MWVNLTQRTATFYYMGSGLWTLDPLTERHVCPGQMSKNRLVILESSFARLGLAYQGLGLILKLGPYASPCILFKCLVHQLSAYLAMAAFLCDLICPGSQIKRFHC